MKVIIYKGREWGIRYRFSFVFSLISLQAKWMYKMTGIVGKKDVRLNGMGSLANENFINLVVLLIPLITLPLEE